MKVALITGGARGIGLGISKALIAAGYDVAICGMRPEEQVRNVVDSLEASGRRVLYCRCDVGVEEERERMLDSLRSTFGCLHVLVNNAGVAPKERCDVLEATEESYDRVMRTNLQGPYFLTQAVAQWMIKQAEGDSDYQAGIINIGSISSSVASPSRGEYCLSKAGMTMATKLWAVRLGEFGIPVYEVQPGITATDMTSGVKEKYDALIAEGLLVQSRWGTPEDIGKAVAALVTGSFPYSTGQIFMVDGGLTLLRL